jgi:hypothetical protein
LYKRVPIVNTVKPKQLLNKKGETNIQHSRYFFLFKFHIAFIIQLRCMTIKHIQKSSFGGKHVSRPYLPQIVCISNSQTYNTWFRQMVNILSTFKRNDQCQNFLSKKGRTNIHHLRHFLLFKFQIAFLFQLRYMSSKNIRISSLGVSQVS